MTNITHFPDKERSAVGRIWCWLKADSFADCPLDRVVEIEI
jgi:hypothetical protein